MPARLLAALIACAAIACDSAPSDETPTGTVQLFLAAMDRAAQDPDARADAYRLMSASPRRALAERAHYVVQVGGRPMEPWEMIGQSRYRQVFAAQEENMRARVDGDRATVHVESADGQRRADVPLVREDGRWRVVIEIPPARERATPP